MLSNREVWMELCEYCPTFSQIDPHETSVATVRSVHSSWYYSQFLDFDTRGFNPFSGSVYFGRDSYFKTFFERGEGDFLESSEWYLYELFFALHDYIHVWAVEFAANQLEVQLIESFGDASELARATGFLLLLSEAAATTFVDFWLLNLEPFRLTGSPEIAYSNLTTQYIASQSFTGEPSFFVSAIESDEFFFELVRLYCRSVNFTRLKNFSDFPNWQKRELDQSQKQRSYAEFWLTSAFETVGDLKLEFSDDDLDFFAPVIFDLCNKMRNSLRQKEPLVLNGGRKFFDFLASPPGTGFPDLRFWNVNSIDYQEFDHSELSTEQRKYFNAQIISMQQMRPLIESAGVPRGKTIQELDAREIENWTGESLESLAENRDAQSIFLPN